MGWLPKAKIVCPCGSLIQYSDMRISNFVIEYLCENEKVRETVFCTKGKAEVPLNESIDEKQRSY